jgi:proteic killer suppression protein
VYRYAVQKTMIRSFRHRGLRRMYERGDVGRLGSDLTDRVALALADLDDARKPSDLDLPGYRLHPLKGDLKGYWSISISGNWRVTFRIEDGDAYDVDLADYH